MTWLGSTIPVLASVLALGGLAVAIWSAGRVRTLRRDLGDLTRSMDALIRNMPRRDPDLVTRKELDRRMGAEIDALMRELSGRDDAPAPVAGSNVVAHPAARRRDGLGTDDPARRRRVADLLAAAIAGDGLEISLQPIVSLSRGETIAFEVFASVRLGPDDHVDIRKIAAGGVLDGAAFEQAMVLATVDTARRRLGTMSERMKLHVAVSEDLLSREGALAGIHEILRVHPGIARSVVLSLPARIFDQDELLEAAAALSDAGLDIAMECETVPAPQEPDALPIRYVKLEAERLLPVAGAPGLPAWLMPGSDTPVIVRNVTSDEDATGLFEMGIDLMCGERFSPPRRLGST